MAPGAPSPAARSVLDPGRAGASLQILLAALLTGLLLVITNADATDIVPRPLVLGVLYATPGVIGLLGAYAHRPSLLIGAAIPLIPGAFLSFAGVTLVFLIPAVLMIAGAANVQTGRLPHGLAVEALRSGLIAVLILSAGWAALFGFARQSCVSTAGGNACSSAAITLDGVLVGAACLAAAIAIAAWTIRSRRAISA